MEIALSAVIGALFGAGLYLLMRRSTVLILVGVTLLTHGVNLLVFLAGGLTRAGAPLVPEPLSAPSGPVSNPLTQALILTAIVIALGIQAFVLVLVRALAGSGSQEAGGALETAED